MGFAQFGTLIDLKAIEDLRGLDVAADGRLRIGAATTHRTIERSADRRASTCPRSRGSRHRVANVRVRNTGTLGGNLAFAEPHSDPATFLLACGATVELEGPDGRRELGIGDFVLGPLWTAREPDEVIVAIHVPPAAEGRRSRVREDRVLRAAGGVGGGRAARGRWRDRRGDRGRRLPDRDAADRGQRRRRLPRRGRDRGARLEAPVRAAGEAFGALDVIADHNGSEDYKRHLAGVLLGRAARGALQEALAHA